ncbi:lipase family protein [Nocardia brasiliensis]|uniref:lipase family protein n=1 Tax=Nocardia brasiliensis TaxID=37326 RepID=UPI0004A75B96|nr:lipase family protein [Nocardia brasiliensis]
MLSLVPFNIDAWQLLYRTNDSHGNPIATVTTVVKPRGPAPAEGFKLLSYQVAEDSTAQYCAMSYVVQQGSIPVDYVNSAEVSLAIALGISQGWVVSIPDYQGPGSAYGAAILGGQATLDGIRATQNFIPAQLTPDARVGVMGYSGGSIPTGWVAENHGEYAPEINIVGVTMGGVAMADLRAVLRSNNFNLGAGLIGAALRGFATEYPEVQHVLDTEYDWFGRFMTSIKGMLCHTQGSAFFPWWNYLGSYTGPGDVLDVPELSAIPASSSPNTSSASRGGCRRATSSSSTGSTTFRRAGVARSTARSPRSPTVISSRCSPKRGPPSPVWSRGCPSVRAPTRKVFSRAGSGSGAAHRRACTPSRIVPNG